MRSKAPLALMEQLIMLLIFALAAAICLQAFVQSNQLSKENALRDKAAFSVETAAEVCKSCHGNGTLELKKLGGQVSHCVWTTWWDQNGNAVENASSAAFWVTVTPKKQSGSLPLGRAAVRAVNPKNHKELFSIEIAWQEDGNDA